MNIGVCIGKGSINTLTISDSIPDQLSALDWAGSQSHSKNIKVGIRYRMLSNEKDVEQMLMQRTYTPDFLTGKQVKDNGKLDICWFENSHDSIIDQENFDRVQEIEGYNIKHTVQMEQMV